MGFTKVAPAGIGTQPGDSITIGDSFLHTTGIDIGHNTGIGVTIRKHGDATFTGIITASAFFGDGSGLEGVTSSGIGTPLSDVDTDVLNKVYYVNKILSIGSTVTIDHPESGATSYTHYTDVMVEGDADLIVADGDTFVPDVLGISSAGINTTSAVGGRIRAGQITNAAGDGAPNFPNGITVTGVVTATTLNQSASGDLSIPDKIVHIGDTNTTIRFPADDTITAETSGSERVRIDSAGNTKLTGAGSTSILSLFVDDTTAYNANATDGQITAGATLFIENDGNSNNTINQIVMQSRTGYGYNRIVATGGSSPEMAFCVNNAERLRIGSDGQIGIGTGANYGTNTSTYNSKTGKSSQVLVSNGGSAAPTWAYTNRPAFMARKSSSQSIDTGTWTKVQLDEEVLDTDNVYDNTTNYRFTVPTGGAGWYMCHFSAGIDDIQSSDYVYARLYLNGSSINHAIGSDWCSAANAVVQASSSHMLHLTDGEYLELYVYHNEGSTEPVEQNRCYFGAFRLNI